MKNLLRTEEFIMLLLAVFGFLHTGFEWWWFPLLLFLPDISMIAYAFNTGTGAVFYNIFHHKGVAVLFFIAGYWAQMPWVELTGIILFAHSSMDRIFGYGLKFPDSFKRTNLGRMGGN